MGFESINQPGQSSEVECNPKTSISLFWLERGLVHQPILGSSNPKIHGDQIHCQPCRSSEIERNPKMSISFIWLESGGGWGSSPITSLADYQKLKVIQKQAFHFLAGEGWQMGGRVHRSARLIIRC